MFFYMGVWASYLFDLWGDLGGNMFLLFGMCLNYCLVWGIPFGVLHLHKFE